MDAVRRKLLSVTIGTLGVKKCDFQINTESDTLNF